MIPGFEGPRGVDIDTNEADMARAENSQLAQMAMRDPNMPFGDDFIHLMEHIGFARLPIFQDLMPAAVDAWQAHVMAHLQRLIRDRRMGMFTGESESMQALRFAQNLSGALER